MADASNFNEYDEEVKKNEEKFRNSFYLFLFER